MKRISLIPVLFVFLIGIFAFQYRNSETVTVFLIGDSTMADYSSYDEDYMKTRYPMMGWGQVFQPYMKKENLASLPHLISGDIVKVDNRARGGRSTLTFFEEGRWSAVYESLQKGDLVLMQFGHNDAAESKPERYVTVAGYKEYLRLFVSQSREKGAVPIILTPVNRNYPWENDRLKNSHGLYHQAAVEVSKELNTHLIDLTILSMDHFTEKGKEYVSQHYFMNLEAGKYEAYPDGIKDNTHFQPEGAKAVAELVYKAMVKLK